MEELGYIYNRYAAGLRSNVSKTVGVILPNIANPFFAGVTAGVSEALGDTEEVVMIGNTLDSPVRQKKLLNQMREYGVDGLIICPASGTEASTLKQLDERGPPVVQVLREVPGYRGDYVSADYRSVITLAMRHLVTQEYKSIAYVGSRHDHSAQRERRAGYLSSCRSLGLTYTHTRTAEVTCHGGYMATISLLGERRSTDAIIFYSDVMALGAMQAIREMGLAVGPDVGVVGCDDIEEAAFSYPKLTSLRLNAHEIGSTSLQLLRMNLKSSGKLRETVLLAPGLIVRGSTSRIEPARTLERSI